jgi:plastocyanin
LRRSRIVHVFSSLEFFGLVLFIFSAGFPPFDDATEVNLTLHMLQHVLIIISGVLVAYPFHKRGSLKRYENKWTGIAGYSIAAGLVVYWHLPGPWDTAVLNPLIHAVEHFSFFGVGLIGGSLIMAMSDSAKIGALLSAFFAHMLYAVILIDPAGGQIYSLYSIAQQNILGWVLLLTGPTLLVGVAYLLLKNPNWLQGATGVAPSRPKIAEPPLPTTQGHSLTLALSVSLVAVLMVYFGATAVAIAYSPKGGGGSVVYIAETPVSWNYSPRNITVIVGVNNTVTWISHSISYDTVTGSNDSFTSGPIAPGQTYTHTFENVGLFEYHCIYHPWMTGYVKVVE